MGFKSRQDVIDAGGELVHEDGGSTWNDGGRWAEWIYRMPDGQHFRVYLPTDYRTDVEITRVFPKTETVTKYTEDPPA